MNNGVNKSILTNPDIKVVLGKIKHLDFAMLFLLG